MERQAIKEEEGHEYVYFVSYSHSKGFGNVEVSMTGEIVDVDAVYDMAKEIEENLSLHDVVILNFFPLRLEKR